MWKPFTVNIVVIGSRFLIAIYCDLLKTMNIHNIIVNSNYTLEKSFIASYNSSQLNNHLQRFLNHLSD